MQHRKLVIAACCLGVFAGSAIAQTPGNVEIYGLLDLAYKKTEHGITEMRRGDNNRLGFRGNEDLGNGYSAFFVLEQRFETDTGTVEGGNRPLYQGQSRVGIKSPYGSFSFGRWLTAVQLNAGFDAFEGRTIGDMGVDIFTKFDSEGANAGNRIANAMFYSSPIIYGFKFDGNIATKEQVAGSSFPYNVTPYSATLDYSNGVVPIADWSRAKQ